MNDRVQNAPHYGDVWGSGYIDQGRLDLATSQRDWSASRSGRFTRVEKAIGTHFIDCVGLRAGVDDIEKWILLPFRESDSDRPVIQPIASRYIDCPTVASRWSVSTAIATARLQYISSIYRHASDSIKYKSQLNTAPLNLAVTDKSEPYLTSSIYRHGNN